MQINLALSRSRFDVTALSKCVLNAFSTNGVAVFSTEIYAHKVNETIINDCISQWENKENIKQIQTVSSDKAALIDSYNCSWLHVAAKMGQTKVVDELLQYADPTLQSDRGTPLFKAALNGQEEVVALLLGKKVNPNQARNDGVTQLYVAAKIGHKKIVKILLDHGATNNSVNGDTPLFIAAKDGHTAIVKQFIDQGIDYVEDAVSAIFLYNDIALNTFLQAGVDVNATWDSKTFLYVAIEENNVNAIKLLLEKGADPGNVITLARANNKEDIIKKLFKEIDDNAIFFNAHGEPYSKVRWLYEAAMQGDSWLVKIFLDSGVNKNEEWQDKNNFWCTETPLSIAIKNGHEDVVKVLLSSDDSVKHDDLLIAAERGHVAVIKMFADSENKNLKDEMMMDTISANLPNLSYRMLQTFKQAGIDFNSEFPCGYLLHYAIENRNPELASNLIKLGCNLTQVDTNKQTALDIAYENDDKNMIEILLHGMVADIDHHLKNTNPNADGAQITEIILDKLKDNTSIIQKLDVLNSMIESIVSKNEKNKTYSFSVFKSNGNTNDLTNLYPIKIAYIKTVQSVLDQNLIKESGMVIDRIKNLDEKAKFAPIDSSYSIATINRWIEANTTVKSSKSPR